MSTQGGALVLAYVLYALTAAGFLAVNVPPYQNPDETNHFLRADNIARGFLVGHRFDGFSGGFTAPEIDDFAKAFDPVKGHPDVRVTERRYAAASAKFGGRAREVSFSNTAIYPPWFYAPSVAALWIGKAGRMDVMQTLYLARLLTALVSCGMVAGAVAVCARAGLDGAALIIFAAATLPMAFAGQAAVSQDGLMLGTAALAGALFARLRATPRAGGFAAMAVCLALMAAARAPYAVLALVPLGAPVGWGARLRGAAFVAAACALWTWLALSAAGIEVSAQGTDSAAQLRVLLDPVRDAALLAATIRETGWIVLTQMVGQLGWLDVSLPVWSIEVALGVLLLAGFAGMEPRGRGAGVVAAAVSFSALAVFVAIYVSWNRVGAPVIEGVQGRYFLPLLMMLAGLGGTLARAPAGAAAWAMAVVLPAVSLGVTMRAVVLRYYLGA